MSLRGMGFLPSPPDAETVRGDVITDREEDRGESSGRTDPAGAAVGEASGVIFPLGDPGGFAKAAAI